MIFCVYGRLKLHYLSQNMSIAVLLLHKNVMVMFNLYKVSCNFSRFLPSIGDHHGTAPNCLASVTNINGRFSRHVMQSNEVLYRSSERVDYDQFLPRNCFFGSFQARQHTANVLSAEITDECL